VGAAGLRAVGRERFMGRVPSVGRLAGQIVSPAPGGQAVRPGKRAGGRPPAMASTVNLSRVRSAGPAGVTPP
jgi:hypothetical protein